MQTANLTYHKQRKHSKNCELPLFVGKATVNNILVDGMSFIEKFSFNPFSEGKRLIHCTTLHKRLFGVDVKKAKDAVRQELARVRATAMEGSFGTQKEHYDLTSFSASTRQTWCSWHTGLRSEHVWPQPPEPKTCT